MANKHMISETERITLLATAARIADMSGAAKSFYIETYGCQMNNHDSERIAGILESCGLVMTADKNSASVILFNTCCVREHAELKVFGNVGALRARKEEHPKLIIGICGCMMQQEAVAKQLYRKYPFVDFIFGTHDMHRLPLILEEVLQGKRVFAVSGDDADIAEGLPIHRLGSASTNVNIMYGCDNFCSYCIVPYVRGRERSRSHERILAEIKHLVKSGYTEVTLLGQNVNSYRSPDGAVNFPELLSMVNDIDGLQRIRFMTSHPKDLSDELIASMAQLSKVCRHIHLPVQSGSTEILAAMNRRYSREDYLELVHKLRAAMPDIEITTDIIVGFPGESERDFEATLSLVREVCYASAYTFMYSKRSGTTAAQMPNQIPDDEKKRRLYALNACVAETLEGANEKYIGTTLNVLVEGCNAARGNTVAYGKHFAYKTVLFPGDRDLIGKYVDVLIEGVTSNSLLGRRVE
ncbi:MAG: tRNA (N6-isopentenyl adenosine(37)-C2)-methylthiotransferase MiaB [Clostridia bacterium]|nr:tRNA (N6-isopentenyl adenosine(37)-C2)-methylthiotransferase MiaB [Clostridia bacterium]